jgi:hypothetical protein
MAAQRTNTVQPKPVGFGDAILRVIDAETAPRRVLFGEMATQVVPHLLNQRLTDLAEWTPVSLLAEGK